MKSKFTRRALLASASSLILLQTAGAQVGDLFTGSQTIGHNGKRVQSNMDFTQGLGGSEIAFMNLIAASDQWKTLTSPPLCMQNPAYVDENFWLKPGSPAHVRAFLMPTVTQRPGNYVIKGEGPGTIRVNGPLNSVEQTVGAGAWTISLASLNRTTAPPYNGFTLIVTPPARGTAYAKNITILHEKDVADYAAGKRFDKQFLLRCKEMGVLRFLNWTYANYSNAAVWRDVIPLSSGNWSYWFDHSRWASNGFVRDATDQQLYTCNYPGFTLSHNAAVFGAFDQHSAPAGAVCTSITVGSSTRLNLDRAVTWAIGSKIGVNVFKLVGGGTQALNSALCRRAWTLTALESGGKVAVLDVNTTGLANPGLQEKFKVGPVFMLNINNTGAKPLISMTGYYLTCESHPSNFVTATDGSQMGFCKDVLAKVIYDAHHDRYITFASPFAANNQYGLGVPANSAHTPYEVMIDLCNEVGAHPWFPLPPMTCNTPGNNPTINDFSDYLPNLLDLLKVRLKNGLIPRLEAGNESALYHTTVAAYGDTMMDTRNRYSNLFDQNNWIGYATSLIGQLAASKYGYSKAQVKTQQRVQVVIPLMSSMLFYSDPSSSNNVLWPRGASTVLASYGGDRAYEWANRICLADYWVPAALENYFAPGTAEITFANKFVAAYDSRDFATATAVANAYLDTAYQHGPIESAATFLNEVAHPGGSQYGRIFSKLKTLCTNVRLWGGGFKATLYEGSYNSAFSANNANVNRLRKEARKYSKAKEITLRLFHDLCDDGVGEFPSIYLLAATYDSPFASFWYNSYDQTQPIYDAAVEFNNGG